MVSFLSLFSGRTSNTCLVARPLNLKEFKPHKFPGSAVITGMFGNGLLRMNDEFFFTHSQTSAGAAKAIAATLLALLRSYGSPK
mmetsp:Transcript_92107/g.260236  ORF Transcript_92107/g.260236 Transcript_92107/m.260236 type:complete len:84 (+) Transcript_92107:315-566(+)